MDRLFRYLEKKMELAEGQFQGRYANTTRSCEKALASKPGVIFPSLPIFIEKKRALGLEPVAQVRVNGQARDHFYVMVRADDDRTVAQLGEPGWWGPISTRLDF